MSLSEYSDDFKQLNPLIYSKGFKLTTMEEVYVSQMGLRENARKYGITHKIIQTWIKSSFSDWTAALSNILSDGFTVAKRGSKLTVKDEENLDDKVQKELNRLRMENEYLKKLNTLVRTKKKLKS